MQTQAQALGYTEEWLAYASELDLHILVKPDTDLDSCFKAWDVDVEEWIKVDGWNFTFEPVVHGMPEA